MHQDAASADNKRTWTKHVYQPAHNAQHNHIETSSTLYCHSAKSHFATLLLDRSGFSWNALLAEEWRMNKNRENHKTETRAIKSEASEWCKLRQAWSCSRLMSFENWFRRPKKIMRQSVETQEEKQKLQQSSRRKGAQTITRTFREMSLRKHRNPRRMTSSRVADNGRIMNAFKWRSAVCAVCAAAVAVDAKCLARGSLTSRWMNNSRFCLSQRSSRRSEKDSRMSLAKSLSSELIKCGGDNNYPNRSSTRESTHGDCNRWNGRIKEASVHTHTHIPNPETPKKEKKTSNGKLMRAADIVSRLSECVAKTRKKLPYAFRMLSRMMNESVWL